MFRKIAFIFACLFILSTPTFAAPADIGLVVNGQNVAFPDQKPVILNDRTFIPVRFLAEALGAEVEWDSAHQTVIIDNKGIQITEDGRLKVRYLLKIGSPQIVYVLYRDNFARDVHVFDIPESPVIMDGRTMLPFRYIAEILGAYVYYDDVKNAAVCMSESSIKDILGNTMKQPLGLNAVLTSVMQEAFQKQLAIYRREQVDKGPLRLNDELMATAGWKVYDMVNTDHYDPIKHSNSDGTYGATRFFSLCKPEKYPNGLPSPVTELIKGAGNISLRPFQLLSFSKEQLLSRYYDFNVFSIPGMLDDIEYWYTHLQSEWGINMHTLDVQSDLQINSHDLSKYKMSSTQSFNEHPLHASHVVWHWNETEYERYSLADIKIWEGSKKHKEGMLRTSIYMGFATQIIDSATGGNYFSAGYSTLLLSQWDYFK